MKYLGLCGLSCVLELKCNSFGAESESFEKSTQVNCQVKSQYDNTI